MAEHQHEWGDWHYNHNGGSEHENYWRECEKGHYSPGCGHIEKVFVRLPQDTQLIDAITDIIEPVLSGQYGRDLAFDLTIEILGVIQKQRKAISKEQI